MNRQQHLTITVSVTALLAAAVASAQAPSAPAPEANSSIPEPIRAPTGEKLVLRAHAMGAQIYLCQPGADGKAQWTLKAPEADLTDDTGSLVGHHVAGPVWQYADGSEVTGKAVARVDSPDSHSIPWLLLEAVGHTGDGVLGSVSHIQRIYTRGGQAPADDGCDASRTNDEVRIPYSADYYFYAPQPAQPAQSSPSPRSRPVRVASGGNPSGG
jgi:hypothetical protein